MTANPVAQVILTVSPNPISADGTAISTVVATARDVNGNAVAAPTAITVALSVSTSSICNLTGATATIAAGATDSSASPGQVTSTTTAGSCSVGGSASGGYTGSVTPVTLTTSALGGIALPASVLAPPGGSVPFTVTLTTPAPTGGAVVNLDTADHTIATVSASVSFAAGATTATATLTGVANGSTSIQASSTNFASTSTLATVKVVTIAFTNPCCSVSVPATRTAQQQVVLSDAAPAGGLVVSLDTLDHTLATTVEASVVVPAGQLTSPAFTVNGVAQGTTTLNATATGVTSGSETVYVGAAPALTLTGSGAWIGTGLHNSTRWYISLNTGADPGGITVTLTSSNPSVISVPQSVAIAGGATYAYYDVAGVAAGSATITATAPGWVSAPAITINAGQTSFTVGSYSTSRTTLSSAETLYIYANTPNCGTCDYAVNPISTTLTVNSTTAGIVTVASPVTIAAGAYYTTASISAPTSQGTYTITASASGVTSATTSTVTVTAPSLSLTGNGAWMGAGLHNAGRWYVSLSNPAPVGGLTVTFTSSDPTVLTVSASEFVPAGQSYVYYDVAGVAAGSATVTASAPAWTSAPAITINVGTPYLTLGSYATSRTTLSAADTLYVYVNTPNCGTCDYAVNAVSIDLAVNSSALAAPLVSVTTPVTIAAGAYSTSSSISTPNAAGTYTITASSSGLTSATTNTVTVTAPTLTLTGGGAWVGTGLHNAGRWYVSLSNPAPTGGLTVSFTSSNTAILAVASSITIPAGQSYGYYDVAGVAAGSATVTATATAWMPAPAVTINVGTSYLTLGNYSATRTTLSAPETLYVYANTPSCGTCDYAVNPISVDLAVNSTTAGIVTVTTPAVISAGAYSATATISTPTSGGTYTITGSSTGLTSGTSSTVTVTQPSMSQNGDQAWIGAGLHNAGRWYVSLSNPAPTGGLTVFLSSTDPTIATVSSSIAIPAGQTYGYYDVAGVASGAVQITASAPGWNGSSIHLNVGVPYLTLSNYSTSRTTLSSPDTLYVYVNSPNCGACDYVVSDTALALNLNTTTAGIVSLGSSAPVVTANGSYATTTISTPTATGTYTITASAIGYNGIQSNTVTVTPPYLNMTGNGAWIGTGLHNANRWYVYLSNPAPAPLTVTLSSSDTTVVQVAPSVAISAGGTYAYFDVTGVAPGSATVTASTSGWTSGTITINSGTTGFVLSGLATSRHVGDPANSITVYAVTPNCGTCDYAVADITVNLALLPSSTSGIVTVTTPLTIPAGNDISGSGSISSPATAGSYTIEMTSTGYATSDSPTITVS